MAQILNFGAARERKKPVVVCGEIGRLIYRYRKLRGKTQGDLALDLMIDRSTVAKYELGVLEVPQHRIKGLARVLMAPDLLEQWLVKYELMDAYTREITLDIA